MITILTRGVSTTYPLQNGQGSLIKCLTDQPRILHPKCFSMHPRREELCAGLMPILHEFENLLGPNFHREVEDKKKKVER